MGGLCPGSESSPETHHLLQNLALTLCGTSESTSHYHLYVFILFLIICICVYPSVDMYTCVHVPVEDRKGHWIPGAGITGSCELSGTGDGVILGPLQKQFAGFTAEPTLRLLIG